MITFDRKLSASLSSNISFSDIGANDIDFDNDAQRHLRYRREQNFLITEPAPYEGRSYREHIEFIRACELVFEIRQETYKKDKDRVLFATSYLRGDAQDDWYIYKHNRVWQDKERGEKSTGPSWEEFRDVLRECVNDEPATPLPTYYPEPATQLPTYVPWMLAMPLERNSVCECYHRYSNDDE